MNHTTIDAVRQQIEFAERAAKKFASDPKLWSYTDAEIAADCLLALRWGMGDDCVLVLKLDEWHRPTIYGQAVRLAAMEEA